MDTVSEKTVDTYPDAKHQGNESVSHYTNQSKFDFSSKEKIKFITNYEIRTYKRDTVKILQGIGLATAAGLSFSTIIILTKMLTSEGILGAEVAFWMSVGQVHGPYFYQTILNQLVNR